MRIPFHGSADQAGSPTAPIDRFTFIALAGEGRFRCGLRIATLFEAHPLDLPVLGSAGLVRLGAHGHNGSGADAIRRVPRAASSQAHSESMTRNLRMSSLFCVANAAGGAVGPLMSRFVSAARQMTRVTRRGRASDGTQPE